jgi:tRNA U34 5-carboxymethylaminomethyl modifying GTPase MnmE/TrmE
MESQTQAIVSAIKETKLPVTQQSSDLGLNWQPIIQGLVSGVANSMGAQLSFPTSQKPAQTQAEVPVTTSQGVDLSPLLAEIKELRNAQQQLTAQMAHQASTIQQLANSTSRIDKLESSMLQLAQSTSSQLIELTQALTQLAKITGNSGGSSTSGGGTSSAPQTPAISVSPGSTIKSTKGVSTTILDFDPSPSSGVPMPHRRVLILLKNPP